MKTGGPFKPGEILFDDKLDTYAELMAKPLSWFASYFPPGTEITRAKCDEMVKEIMRGAEGHEVWINDVYQVNVTKPPPRRPGDEDVPGIIHLSIKRRDRQPIHDWRDLQEIKNELVGPEFEAVELYPRESRLVDSANQFHLWVLDREGLNWPVGFNNGRHVDNETVGKSVNRPRT